MLQIHHKTTFYISNICVAKDFLQITGWGWGCGQDFWFTKKGNSKSMTLTNNKASKYILKLSVMILNMSDIVITKRVS